jgi:hypothetical protein
MTDRTDKRLRELLSRLSEAEAGTLLAFAEFLASRGDVAPGPGVAPESTAVPQPEPVRRPEKESVVKAIKRLAATYPMLDRSKMLNETSALMTQHVMHGREAVEVIDELEIVFRSHYERFAGLKGSE